MTAAPDAPTAAPDDMTAAPDDMTAALAYVPVALTAGAFCISSRRAGYCETAAATDDTSAAPL